MRQLEDILRSMNNNIIGIESIESFRPGYLFFPARVTLRLGTGNCITYVVKTQETYKPLEFEMKEKSYMAFLWKI